MKTNFPIRSTLIQQQIESETANNKTMLGFDATLKSLELIRRVFIYFVF